MGTVVVAGNPIDGITIWGLFVDREVACKWATINLNCDWWLTSVLSAENDDDDDDDDE